MIADQFAMKFNCLLNAAASLPIVFAEPSLNSELAFDQILPGSRVDAVTPRGCRRASPSKPDWTFSRHPAFHF